MRDRGCGTGPGGRVTAAGAVIRASRRGATLAAAIAVCVGVAGCGYATDPAERPLEGSWLGAVSLIDGGGVSWQLWLREDGQGNVSGRVSRTDFRRIPHPAEQVFPGTVSGVHEPSRVLLMLDYGESTERYDGRIWSDDRITGLIERGTTVRNIGTLEFRRIGQGVDG